jgi:hypothetical protein
LLRSLNCYSTIFYFAKFDFRMVSRLLRYSSSKAMIGTSWLSYCPPSPRSSRIR